MQPQKPKTLAAKGQCPICHAAGAHEVCRLALKRGNDWNLCDNFVGVFIEFPVLDKNPNKNVAKIPVVATVVGQAADLNRTRGLAK